MRTLTISYHLQGSGLQRGYAFSTPTDGIAPETVKAIWRGAMPRGSVWNRYIGARSLKCLPLPSGEVALCDVTVTDQRDEAGRTGIRQAEILLGTAAEIDRLLHERLADLPAEITAEAEQRLGSREWQLLFKKHRDTTKPRSMVKPQTILTQDYTPEGWQFVEACILLLATRSTLLTNLIEVSPRVNPFADRRLSFTTLALDPHDELRVIGMPRPHVDEGHFPAVLLT